MGDFETKVAEARKVERAVAAWLMVRGWSVLPVYDYCGLAQDKAPKLHGAKTSLVTPDLLAARSGASRWVEVKWKARADWTRMTGRYETGIDRRLWEHYLKVQTTTGIPVWLVFVHELEREVRGETLDKLKTNARFSPNFGRSGGMFFGWDDLRRLLTIDELSVAA